jgi:hypothetical protein
MAKFLHNKVFFKTKNFLCPHTTKISENKSRKVCQVEKNVVILQRYPENNLFTLKRTNTY